MTLPEGKFKMGLKHIYMKRDHMFDGTKEVTNKEDLDANANVTLLVSRYGLAKNFDVRIVLPYKHIDATA